MQRANVYFKVPRQQILRVGVVRVAELYVRLFFRSLVPAKGDSEGKRIVAEIFLPNADDGDGHTVEE